MKKKLLAGAFAGLSVLVITLIVYGYQMFYTPNILADSEVEKELFIPKGADIQTVLDSLETHDHLSDPVTFMFISRPFATFGPVHQSRYG